ncbi:MAG: ABC transporter permease [Polyangiaceae bacterium]|nr:ABC transporter permease [Polyangiaceae bacterium]MCW5791423.1 ABC transporter permease [Polyangiaceae bacterium]
MTLRALMVLLGRDLARTRGPLVTAGFGIAVGVAALVFFLALGLGAQRVLLGDVFPIDQVELEPQKTSVGVLSLFGGEYQAPGVGPEALAELRQVPGVAAVYPKLRFRFPSSARGGAEIFGKEIGTHEMLGDGIDAALVSDLEDSARFVDPLTTPGKSCLTDADCAAKDYCERPSDAPSGQCSAPVPAVISRYLVEVFDHAVAPAHGLPPVAGTLVRQAKGVEFRMTLGTSLLGVAPRGKVRTVKIQVVGVSDRAVDLGVTLPIEVVRRWNDEYAGEEASRRYSSVVVRTDPPSATSRVIERGAALGLVPTDTRARDVSVLVSGVLALLVLVSSVILLVGALNISHTFRMLVSERSGEIALYRALGASARDMRRWLFSLATVVGLVGGLVGAGVARLCALLADWRAAVDLPAFPFKPDSFFDFPPWLFLLATGFAIAFAWLGALGPALRAARTDPASALGRPV